MANDADSTPSGYVDAASALLAIPIDGDHRPVVDAVMERIAGFAADVASVELGIEVEIAGVFVP
jgi:hypothetical protein